MKPIIFKQTDLKLKGFISSMALSTSGHRLYLGLTSSDPQRRNLVVLTIDKNGKIAGNPRRYSDSELALPSDNGDTLWAILPDTVHLKLYLVAHSSNLSRALTVFDLDGSGEPMGLPRSYESDLPHQSLLGLARHPTLNLLYMVGWGDPTVYTYKLDAQGEPQGSPIATSTIGGQGKFDVAVSSNGEKLYLGTYPDTLEVINLDSSGIPVAGSLKSFPASSEPGQAEPQYFRFQYTPQAIYRRHQTQMGTIDIESWPLIVWPLDADGHPIGQPVSHGDILTAAVIADAKHSQLWVLRDTTFKDAYTGQIIVDGVEPVVYQVDADGTPIGSGQSYPKLLRQKGELAAISSSGLPAFQTASMDSGFLGNRVRDNYLRITILEAQASSGSTPSTFPMFLEIALTSMVSLGQDLVVGQPSSWIHLDPYLKDKGGQILFRFWAFPPGSSTSLNLLKLRLEVAQGDPTKKANILKTLTDTVNSTMLAMLIPGYGYEPPERRVEAIELLSEHAQQYLKAAQQVALDSQERPQQFVVSCSHLLGGQGHLGQLQAEAEAVALLGINTVNAYYWDNIAPKTINSVLDSAGLKRRALAVYNPLSPQNVPLNGYFDFIYNAEWRANLKQWAENLVQGVAQANGGTPASVVDFKLSDEPGWYYPFVLKQVRDNLDWLMAFRSYLEQQGLQPGDVGQTSWRQVFPIGASAATDLPSRRLFYWTMRFFPEAASKGHAIARAALEQTFGHSLNVDVNWNNFGSVWYTASPNQQIANNPDVGPDSAMGAFDWLESGRLNAHTLWTEDWFIDQQAQNWSFYGDILRSSAMLGNQSFGGYVVGPTLGSHPAGASYKILSLVGHGAKTVDLYSFGPYFLFPGNCWSEMFSIYGAIADAFRLIGRTEHLLYPGRSERGKVAILLPGTSGLWETKQHNPIYSSIEPMACHFALIHAGYTVDFIDETDIINGALVSGEYTTLYVIGPNLDVKAQKPIGAWVHNGGMLVVMPGGATSDQYNTPTTLLDLVLGLTSRIAVRDDAYAPQPTDTLTVKDAGFGFGSISLFGPVVSLGRNGAAIAATLGNGNAGITINSYGKGHAVAYAFFPGLQYWLTADRSDPNNIPLNWGDKERRIITAPVALANTSRPVLSSLEGVEVCRLQSEHGIALVLLNWRGEMIPSFTVTVPQAKKFDHVTSAVHSPVKTHHISDETIAITLPLKDVDILLLE